MTTDNPSATRALEVWEVANKTTSMLFGSEASADKFIAGFGASVGGGLRKYKRTVIDAAPSHVAPINAAPQSEGVGPTAQPYPSDAVDRPVGAAPDGPCTETALCRVGWVVRENDRNFWKRRAEQLEAERSASASREDRARALFERMKDVGWYRVSSYDSLKADIDAWLSADATANVVPRCPTTGNPCGTDTVFEGQECPASPGWVSPTERQPDTDGRLWAVLTERRENGKLTGYVPTFEYYHFDNGWATDDRIVFWLDAHLHPLPKVPNE